MKLFGESFVLRRNNDPVTHCYEFSNGCNFRINVQILKIGGHKIVSISRTQVCVWAPGSSNALSQDLYCGEDVGIAMYEFLCAAYENSCAE